MHALRNRVGADLVHLIVDGETATLGGRANIGGPFGLTIHNGGGVVFAHELGHNMALEHDRWQKLHYEDGVYPHPAYGYVNQRAFESGASPDTGWLTIMSYHSQCYDTDIYCPGLLRFSNPRQRHEGDLLGVAYGSGDAAGVSGPADAAAVIESTLPAAALWRARRVPGANRPPAAVGTLPDRRLTPGGTLTVDVWQAFVDPDGDVLTYTVSSSAPGVVTVRAAGAVVTLTAVAEGEAVVRVTATDPDGLDAAQAFAVTVAPANRPPEAVGTLPDVRMPEPGVTSQVDLSAAFDDPDGDALSYAATSSAPGVVAVSAAGADLTLTAVALGEAVVRVTATDPDGLGAAQSFPVLVTAPFTDDPLRPGSTPVRAVHFTELRARVDILRREAGLAPFAWTDRELRPGVTPVRRVHLLELRSALAEAYAAAGRPAPRWTDPAPEAAATPIRTVHLMELRAAVLALE